MITTEYSNYRSKRILEKARELAEDIPLKKYLMLRKQAIKDEELHQSDNCPDTEERWFEVFSHSRRKGADLIDKRIEQPVAQLMNAKVVGLHPWIRNAPEETNLTVAVKNHTHSSALQELIGRPNVLVIYGDVAFVGRQLRSKRVCVTRPVIGIFQQGMIAMFKNTLKHTKNR